MNTMKSSWRLTRFTLLLASAFTFSYNAAATPKPAGLLSTLPANGQVELPQQAIFGMSNVVNINYGHLRSGRFFIDLPDSVSFEAVRDAQYKFGDGKSAWVGHVNGDTKDRIVIGRSGNALSATFMFQGRMFKLEPRPNGLHVVSEVTTGDPAPELDPIPVMDLVGTGDPSVDAAGDGGSIIDVLVAYTPRMLAIYGAEGAEALVVQAVAETNQAYANSGINAQLNLVQAVLTDYVESGSMDTDLSRLRATDDGYMDELHSLRNSFGADLVSLIEHEPAYCGLAYRMTSLSTSFAANAFSIVHHSCATGYYSFAHELGHNQGAHHDPANASGAIYPYAYGYQEPYNNFRTVMAYNCSGGCTRVSQFSNPNVLYGGQPTGIVDYTDNTRTLNSTAGTVASFRAARSAVPSTPGNLAAAAAGSSTVRLDWSDTSGDESGFRVERSEDGASFVQIASLEANTSSYTDDNLKSDTLFSYRARSWNSAGNSSYSNVASAATPTLPLYVEQLAIAESNTAGSLIGTYQDTWYKDGVAEIITEQLSGKGKKADRYGYLQHTWSFDVAPGNATVFVADAKTDARTDSFTFAYSTDGQQWVNMFTVNESTSGELQFFLPAGTSGTVYVRVKDDVRSVTEPTSYSVQIDHLMIRSHNGSIPGC